MYAKSQDLLTMCQFPTMTCRLLIGCFVESVFYWWHFKLMGRYLQGKGNVWNLCFEHDGTDHFNSCQVPFSGTPVTGSA